MVPSPKIQDKVGPKIQIQKSLLGKTIKRIQTFEAKDILNLKLNILGENNSMLITATWIGKLCFYMVIILLVGLFAWNINLLFSKENDIYRSSRLSYDCAMEGEIDLVKENWMIAFEFTYSESDK